MISIHRIFLGASKVHNGTLGADVDRSATVRFSSVGFTTILAYDGPNPAKSGQQDKVNREK